jgi:sugar phosphate permease
VLAAGTVAQASFSAITVGLAVLAPVLRDEYDLSLSQVGVVLSAAWLGATVTLLPWGLAADRYGERVVLVLGLLGSSACLVGASDAGSFEVLLALLVLSGAAGASVNSASGRAVMHWFAPSERGLALGIRQTAIPLGGLVVAIVLPGLAAAGGSKAAFVFLAACSVVGALVGGLGAGGAMEDGPRSSPSPDTSRRSALATVALRQPVPHAQVAVIDFGVLFLHDEHGLATSDAALAIAASQVLAVALRVGLGRWSDVLGSRVVPLRRVGLAVAASLVLIALLADGPLWLLVPAVALAGGFSMAWNGLSFTAAAELAGTARSGAAIGFQQTVLSGLGVLAPLLFAATVSSASWAAAFLVGLSPRLLAGAHCATAWPLVPHRG